MQIAIIEFARHKADMVDATVPSLIQQQTSCVALVTEWTNASGEIETKCTIRYGWNDAFRRSSLSFEKILAAKLYAKDKVERHRHVLK